MKTKVGGFGFITLVNFFTFNGIFWLIAKNYNNPTIIVIGFVITTVLIFFDTKTLLIENDRLVLKEFFNQKTTIIKPENIIEAKLWKNNFNRFNAYVFKIKYTVNKRHYSKNFNPVPSKRVMLAIDSFFEKNSVNLTKDKDMSRYINLLKKMADG
ncbi:MAG: hypothetical protein SFW35_08500 [Chitinophagales bacterium]|nr:hypothetical protein [Chitinophagales bacterium]